jgi:hypothetical protein
MHQAKGVPSSFADRYRMREIQKRLTQELHAASERIRLFQGTAEEKEVVIRAYRDSVRRFAEFGANGIVPDDLKNVK